ncbi:MAG: sulfite exporter TauE/SafE family protein [Pirellulales bacterium]|nr:sulfite exporter TauE/SafE family protein [Pirellulales bacterium]
MVGLLGSGGSILTVPVLVYLLGHEEKIAISESLAIVGGVASAAAIRYAIARSIEWRSVVVFGLPAMMGTYIGAWLAQFVSGTFQMILFAGVMLVAARFMFGRRHQPAAPSEGEVPLASESEEPGHAMWKIVLEGLAVGILTGLVGVGGGFLIVPTLVLLGKLPMRQAIGTSLVIVALKSGTGLIKYLAILEEQGAAMNWATVGWFCLFGIVGSLVGSCAARRVNQRILRRVFAAFLVVMGIFVATMQVIELLGERDTPETPRTASP